MARHGQIPPYGKYFRRESLPYSPEWAGRRYVLKADERYYIISDKTSKQWHVFFNGVPLHGGYYPTFTRAMARITPVDATASRSKRR